MTWQENTGDCLTEVTTLIGQENTGDCLTEVTTCVGLTENTRLKLDTLSVRHWFFLYKRGCLP
jgi:hypothetical protein